MTHQTGNFGQGLPQTDVIGHEKGGDVIQFKGCLHPGTGKRDPFDRLCLAFGEGQLFEVQAEVLGESVEPACRIPLGKQGGSGAIRPGKRRQRPG